MIAAKIFLLPIIDSEKRRFGWRVDLVDLSTIFFFHASPLHMQRQCVCSGGSRPTISVQEFKNGNLADCQLERGVSENKMLRKILESGDVRADCIRILK